MGRRGPKPTPTVLKIQRGNPGKRPINEDEPELPPGELDPPKELKGQARKEWERLAPALIDSGLLTMAERSVFLTYCRLHGRAEKIQAIVDRIRIEDAQKLGYLNLLLKVEAAKKQHAETLGLTPTTRSSVKAKKSPAQRDARKQRFFGASGQNKSSA